MKTFMVMIATLAVSTVAFAGKKDLKTMNVLIGSGAESVHEMSKTQVGYDEVNCSYTHMTKSYACSMTDINGNQGAGKKLTITGTKAASIFNLLMSEGAPADNGMGKYFVGIKSIRCTQVAAGVADGSVAQRTTCSFDGAE